MEISYQSLPELYARRMRRNGLADGTITKYRAAASHFLEWWGREPELAGRPEIEAYLDAWAASLQVSPKADTVRMRIAALTKFYDYLDATGRMKDESGADLPNPVAKVERPRSRRKPNDWLRPEEREALRDATKTRQERVFVELLLWTGLRSSEACALRWRDLDLDLERGELRVRKSKTASGVRVVPVLPELNRELRAWRRHVEERGLYWPDGPVLVTGRRTHSKAPFLWRVVKRVAGRAGVRVKAATDEAGFNVSEITPHTFRRTFATELINRGVRLEVISHALGHADTRVTQAYYAELLDETARNEILEAWAS